MNKPSSASNPQLFHCPTCGASLPNPEASTVRCQYCGSNVLVPPEFQPKKEPVQPVFSTPAISYSSPPVIIETSSRSPVGTLIGIIVMLAVIGSIIIGVLVFTGIFATTSMVSQTVKQVSTQVVSAPTRAPANTAVPTAIPTATPIPPASIALQIGGKGTGPGQFDDPRSIAVDLDGNIYVANYQGGRVQKFDPSGKFLMLIQVEPGSNMVDIITDMAVDLAGNLYVVRGGDIVIFSNADGKLLDTIPNKFPGLLYRRVALDPTNNLYAVGDSQSGGNDLYMLEPGGRAAWKQQDFIYKVNQNDPADVQSLAVDGLGTIFALDRRGPRIFKFDNQGQFIDQFGGATDGPDNLRSPMSMAVDGKGRIFVADSFDIKVFDNQGGFITSFHVENSLGVPFDMAFDLQGNLYLVTNQNFTFKYTLNFGK